MRCAKRAEHWGQAVEDLKDQAFAYLSFDPPLVPARVSPSCLSDFFPSFLPHPQTRPSPYHSPPLALSRAVRADVSARGHCACACAGEQQPGLVDGRGRAPPYQGIELIERALVLQRWAHVRPTLPRTTWCVAVRGRLCASRGWVAGECRVFFSCGMCVVEATTQCTC